MTKVRESKHAKYSTPNPISNKIVSHFLEVAGKAYALIENKERYLEAGCGEGHMSKHLFEIERPKEVFAFDIDEHEVKDAKINLSDAIVIPASIYHIPFESKFFDLVVCFEVLEHLEEPREALEELKRVSCNRLILSVPREPLWRIMNMARLKYWNAFGNTPGHLNHWSRKKFIAFVSEYFEIEKIYTPIPWTMLICRNTHGKSHE